MRDVKCPFMDAHNDRMIRCEGIMEDCKNIIAFADGSARDWFMRVYCKEHFEKCEYYRLLMREKYDTEHAGEE